MLQIYEFSPGSAILSGSIPACLQKASIKSSTTRLVWNPASRIRAKRRTVSGASRKVMFWRLIAGGSVGFPAPCRRPPDVIVVLSVFRIANIAFLFERERAPKSGALCFFGLRLALVLTEVVGMRGLASERTEDN